MEKRGEKERERNVAMVENGSVHGVETESKYSRMHRSIAGTPVTNSGNR